MLKYIRFSHRGFVVFESSQTHKDMAAKLNPDRSDRVESAGFVYLNGLDSPPRLVCRGESSSLSISSKDGDTDSLTRKVTL